MPNDLLTWSSRKRKLLRELDFCSPDIICLQEVDRFKDLEEDLASRGYVGLYKVRTGGMPDGCAIFWRKVRFQLLQERSFEFSMLGMRDNVAQLCVLQLTVPGAANNRSPSVFRTAERTQSHRLVVGNIHVLFNPRRGEIKLGQCRAFLEQVHNLSSIWHGAPVVIGGDFNSTPSSAVYEFLAKSELDLSNLDRRYLSGQVPKKLGSKGRKSGKDAPVQGTLEEMLKRSLRAQLASQEGNKATLCTNYEKAEEPLSGTGPPCDSPAELLVQRCIQEIGSCSTQSLNGSFSEGQTATTSQIHLSLSPGTNLGNGNNNNFAIEQFSVAKNRMSDLDVPNAVLEGLHENRLPSHDSLVQHTTISVEEAHTAGITGGNFRNILNNTCDIISDEAHAAETSSLSTVESSVPQEEFIKSMPYDSLDLKQRCFDDGNPSSASKVLKKEHAENGQDKHQWDLEELRVATGKLDRTSIQHKLNLCSVYSEIQGQTDTRDAKGEPLLTTCHKDFTGTVDYIWRNDGLKTMKVLDTVPLNAFVRNKGLPIKVWGSDHLAIACELAFTQRGK